MVDFEGVFYIGGAVLYAARVPERFTHVEDDEHTLLNNPLSGTSRHFWSFTSNLHVMVVIAAFVIGKD